MDSKKCLQDPYQITPGIVFLPIKNLRTLFSNYDSQGQSCSDKKINDVFVCQARSKEG